MIKFEIVHIDVYNKNKMIIEIKDGRIIEEADEDGSSSAASSFLYSSNFSAGVRTDGVGDDGGGGGGRCCGARGVYIITDSTMSDLIFGISPIFLSVSYGKSSSSSS